VTPDLAQLHRELAALDRRLAAIAAPLRPRLTLAALVNFCLFGRWPGEAPYQPMDDPEPR
jgi:hypothetical protein